MISDLRREAEDNCPLLGYYAACSGNSLPTFWDNLSVPTSRVKSIVPKRALGIITNRYIITQKEFSSQVKGDEMVRTCSEDWWLKNAYTVVVAKPPRGEIADVWYRRNGLNWVHLVHYKVNWQDLVKNLRFLIKWDKVSSSWVTVTSAYDSAILTNVTAFPNIFDNLWFSFTTCPRLDLFPFH